MGLGWLVGMLVSFCPVSSLYIKKRVFVGALLGWFGIGVKNRALFTFILIALLIWYVGIGLYAWGVLGQKKGAFMPLVWFGCVITE